MEALKNKDVKIENTILWYGSSKRLGLKIDAHIAR